MEVGKFISDSVIVVGKFVKLNVHFRIILFEFCDVEDFTRHVLNFTPDVVHVLHLFDFVNIHGIGGLWEISGQ